MRKYSRQRELIVNYLQTNRSHPTAEQIYADLKLQNPALSLSTVYRNLRLLVEDGVILRLDTGENTDRYDADLRIHSHFICMQCKQVTDVFQPLLSQETLENALGRHFTVRQHSLNIYGLCDQCSQSADTPSLNKKN